MKLRMTLLLGLLATAGCASTQKFYDGPERDPAELVTLSAANAYVYSINGRRTDHAKDPDAELLVLPGTQQLIVHLDERMAAQYGRVGMRATFCAVAGHHYVVYPMPDMIARLWEPAVKDAATDRDVSRRPCATAEPAPAPAPVVPAPASAPVAPPPAATPPAMPSVGAPIVPPAAAPSAGPVSPPPPPGVMAAGAQARLTAPARTRSLADAPPAKGLDAGTTVTLKVPLKKDTGTWWYVAGPTGSGWARESELELVAP